ncbi:hypothetical protein L3X38_002801 [Prunus dulcis]|uniref:Uncharacterized protein n=1 Tax=Prunus dulcis TaxID=3755 RepID=A0AAD4WUP0_PRUDU|nr:hypothetical protein L3X38_002801 [Prunus dulcis]
MSFGRRSQTSNLIPLDPEIEWKGRPPAAAAVGTGAKRTGSASASRPSPPPRSAAAPAAGKRRFSPECRPNFAAADLPPPAAISGDQGRSLESRFQDFPAKFYRFGHPVCPRMWRRMGEGGGVSLSSFEVLMPSRARRISRISIRTSFDYRTDIAYWALSGFDRLGPLDGPENNIC